jgi:hypothetical protein
MQFDEAFVKPAENVNLYLGTSNFLEAAKASGMQPSQLVQIRTNLENRPLSFEQCIDWARLKFQEEYSNEIQQLLHSLPRDMVSLLLPRIPSLCRLISSAGHERGNTFLVGTQARTQPRIFQLRGCRLLSFAFY